MSDVLSEAAFHSTAHRETRIDSFFKSLSYSNFPLKTHQTQCDIVFISKVYFIIKMTEICTASKNIFIHRNTGK